MYIRYKNIRQIRRVLIRFEGRSWQIFEKPFNAVPSVSAFLRSKLINLSTVAVVSIVAFREDDNAFPAGGGKQEEEDQREG